MRGKKPTTSVLCGCRAKVSLVTKTKSTKSGPALPPFVVRVGSARPVIAQLTLMMRRPVFLSYFSVVISFTSAAAFARCPPLNKAYGR